MIPRPHLTLVLGRSKHVGAEAVRMGKVSERRSRRAAATHPHPHSIIVPIHFLIITVVKWLFIKVFIMITAFTVPRSRHLLFGIGLWRCLCSCILCKRFELCLESSSFDKVILLRCLLHALLQLLQTLNFLLQISSGNEVALSCRFLHLLSLLLYHIRFFARARLCWLLLHLFLGSRWPSARLGIFFHIHHVVCASCHLLDFLRRTATTTVFLYGCFVQ
mmetsp:Transcript_2482/g.4581  ORF Transcript_2482/g.4581 Transcript_2482/m.4581 type:complete len:219 (-) Transcript_2482:584-1240(-)